MNPIDVVLWMALSTVKIRPALLGAAVCSRPVVAIPSGVEYSDDYIGQQNRQKTGKEGA